MQVSLKLEVNHRLPSPVVAAENIIFSFSDSDKRGIESFLILPSYLPTYMQGVPSSMHAAKHLKRKQSPPSLPVHLRLIVEKLNGGEALGTSQAVNKITGTPEY